MYEDTLTLFATLARKKADTLKQAPGAFYIGAMMAGAYIGLGILLIFTLGAAVDPAWQKPVMSFSFGIALTLVVFAGAELFTGHTMYMTIGCWRGKTNVAELLRVWASSWVFNLVGSVALVLLFITGGGGIIADSGLSLLNKVASYKMNSSAVELIARGALCNWLVCLALWMSARVNSDSAKAIVIFWCLFAFIASGYEHSIANMTVLSLALLLEPTSTITVTGMAHNLAWVTLGNIIGGSVFMAIAYMQASTPQPPTAQTSDTQDKQADPHSTSKPVEPRTSVKHH